MKKKIALVQFKSDPGNFADNMDRHILWIKESASHAVSAIFFPEMSLTGYTTTQAGNWSVAIDDPRLNALQRCADQYTLVIGAGIPMQSVEGILIAMILFRPRLPRTYYAKQELDPDELAFFQSGTETGVIQAAGQKIGLAICYESLQPAHLEATLAAGAQVYVSSVAKTKSAIIKANRYFPEASAQHSTPIIMVNAIGGSQELNCAGGSAIWNHTGRKMVECPEQEEALFVWNQESLSASIIKTGSFLQDSTKWG